jgi:hypothetical protein
MARMRHSDDAELRDKAMDWQWCRMWTIQNRAFKKLRVFIRFKIIDEKWRILKGKMN